MKAYFVDTSFLLAIELVDDQDHERALRAWKEVTASQFRLVTTSYIFDETVTFLNARGLHERAVKVGESLLISPTVELVHVTESMFLNAWELFQTYDDKKFSLTDCFSFLIMRMRKMQRALAFDRDFVRAGFSIIPAQ